MRTMSKLRRSGRPGLWFSACGRFTVRKLGNGSWMVSPVSSPSGGGPYSNWMGSRLLAQRFPSKGEAAEALDVAFQMSAKLHQPTKLEWRRVRPGRWKAQVEDMVVLAQKEDKLWRVTSMPEEIYQIKLRAESMDEDDRMSRFGLETSVRYKTSLLGTSRTLAGAKQLSAEEMAWF